MCCGSSCTHEIPRVEAQLEMDAHTEESFCFYGSEWAGSLPEAKLFLSRSLNQNTQLHICT